MDSKLIYFMLSKSSEHEWEAPVFGRKTNLGSKSTLKYEKLVYKVPRKAFVAANDTSKR